MKTAKYYVEVSKTGFAPLEEIFETCQNEAKKEYEEKLRWIPVEEKLPELKETQYMVETTSKSGLRSYWIIDSQYDIDCLKEFRVSWRHFL